MEEYILLEKSQFDTIEKFALSKLENNKDRPMSESSIEARAILDLINWINKSDVYKISFIDNKIIGSK